jgi:ferrochelatase
MGLTTVENENSERAEEALPSTTTSKNTLLVMNLGSPSSTSVPDVRSYLQEFLMDPLVIDIPAVPRALLVYTVISLFRSRRSAKAYKKVWDSERGSPLLYHSEDFTHGVKEILGDGYHVELGMRYAEPRVEDALKKLVASNSEKITIALMYPHYALSSTETAEQKCEEILDALNFQGERVYIKDFFAAPEFIDALSKRATEHLPEVLGPNDRVLMSFHGIPERHLSKLPSYEEDYCLTAGGRCCDQITEHNSSCYRAQCFETARLLAADLGLTDEQYFVSFQSRLGRTPWIKPYTDLVLEEWAKEGIENVYVMCPAFVADCLETLEEIEMEAKEEFIEHGGKSLELIPCLNAHKSWLQNFVSMMEKN